MIIYFHSTLGRIELNPFPELVPHWILFQKQVCKEEGPQGFGSLECQSDGEGVVARTGRRELRVQKVVCPCSLPPLVSRIHSLSCPLWFLLYGEEHFQGHPSQNWPGAIVANLTPISRGKEKHVLLLPTLWYGVNMTDGVSYLHNQ